MNRSFFIISFAFYIALTLHQVDQLWTVSMDSIACQDPSADASGENENDRPFEEVIVLVREYIPVLAYNCFNEYLVTNTPIPDVPLLSLREPPPDSSYRY